MANDSSCVRIYPVLSWIEGLFIMYRAEQYETTWSAVVGGLLREFAVADRKNLDFEALTKHVLDSATLKEARGEPLLAVVRDIEVLKKRREAGSPHQLSTQTSTFTGYRRRRAEWAVGVTYLGLSLLDFAIVDYYATRLGRPIPGAFKTILSLYIVADKRLKMDEFEQFIKAAGEQVSKEDRAAIEEGWQVLVEQRQHCQRRRKEHKAKIKTS